MKMPLRLQRFSRMVRALRFQLCHILSSFVVDLLKLSFPSFTEWYFKDYRQKKKYFQAGTGNILYFKMFFLHMRQSLFSSFRGV